MAGRTFLFRIRVKKTHIKIKADPCRIRYMTLLENYLYMLFTAAITKRRGVHVASMAADDLLQSRASRKRRSQALESEHEEEQQEGRVEEYG